MQQRTKQTINHPTKQTTKHTKEPNPYTPKPLNKQSINQTIKQPNNQMK